ncbi:MAG TPA: TIGR02996 domain-containing protein [Gemmataceae bacterium]|nr:TIGR02996 domain-containing protein [Gemmataceae bacterium]
MTHANAFLQDILADPDDDAPRLIFADWLEEQGDVASVARAEFIRVQCALAVGEVSEQRRAELERRQQQILESYASEWARPIRRLIIDWEYHRGFIDDVGMLAGTFLTHASRLFRHVPIRHLRLWTRTYPESIPVVEIEPMNMAALADNEHLRRLRSLVLSDNYLQSRDVRALVVSEHLTHLRALDLSYNRIGDGGIRALAGSPLLSRLEHLNLRGNDLGAGGLRVLTNALEELARSPDGLCLHRLELFYDNLSAAAQRVIANSPVLRRLVRG